MEEDSITVAGVVETHLRETEEPPTNKDYNWVGNNKGGTERRGGGVGALSKIDEQWDRVQTKCSEHVWLVGSICGKRVAVGVVYMWTGKGAEEKDKELFKRIAQDVEVINLPCVVVGDFNAHIDTLDDATDRAGQRLLDWVNATGLVIANTTEKCKGRTTWAVGNKSSCIDYCILSPELFDELDSMEIDESGEKKSWQRP